MNRSRALLRNGLLVLPLMMAWSGAPALAQDGLGISPNSNEPIDVRSSSVELDQKTSAVTFIGNVIATQGESRLTSDKLRISYQDKPSGGREITELYASGNVVITSGEDQSATGQWARYDRRQDVMTMGDSVVLSQGGNVLQGSLLTMDLETDKSTLKGAGNGSGRVKGLFKPEEGQSQ